MHCLTINNVSDRAWQTISERARQHGRAIEEEVRGMLERVGEEAQQDVKLGTLLADIGREIQLTDEEVEIFNTIRSKEPARYVDFG